MKTFLVVNPRSANGATGRKWPQIAGQLSSVLGDFGFAFTEKPMDAMLLARKALQDGFRCVVAVGGDGTVNEVVNGFFMDGKALNPDAALGVIPRGTGGDFRKAFDWDLELSSALDRLKTEDTRPLDVGLVEYTTSEGKAARRYFVNVLSFGIGGLVDQKVNQSSKALGGKLSFMLASTKALLQYADRRVRFSCDGGPFQEAKITSLAVANGKFFGGGMKVAPNADPSDGEFDVTLWSGYGLVDFAFRSAGVYSGRHVEWKGTRTWRCKTLKAESDDEVLIDCDGEQPGKLPCSVSMLPGAIRVKI